MLLNTTTSGRKEQKNLYSTSTHYWFMILPVLPVRDKQKSLMQTKIAISRKKGREKQKQPVTADQCLPNLLEESSSIPLAGTAGEKKRKHIKSDNSNFSSSHWSCNTFAPLQEYLKPHWRLPHLLLYFVSIPCPWTTNTCFSSTLAKLISFTL